MLKSMRDAAGSPFIKVLLIMLVLSFISFYGFTKVRGGCNPDTVVEVNGEPISLNEYISAFRNSYENARRYGMFKGGREKEMMDYLKQMVLANLVNAKVKIQQARKLGLSVSDAELAATIRSQFTDPSTGQFSDKYYEMYLRQFGLTSEQFEEMKREGMLLGKLDEFVKSGVKISEQEVLSDFKAKNESINLKYVKFDQSDLLPTIKDPDAKTLASFFEENKAEFKSDQQRRIEYIYLAPEDFIDMSDDALLRFFNERFSSRPTEEYKGVRVRASHILVAAEKGLDEKALLEKAKKIEARIRGGESFAEIAASTNTDGTKFTGGDLGYFGTGKMVKAFEEAAFRLKPGEVSGPAKTQFGLHIIKVTDRIEPGEVTFARLKNEVRVEYMKETKTDPELSESFQKPMIDALKGIKEAALKDPKASLEQLSSKSPVTKKIRYGKTGLITLKDVIEGISDSSQLLGEASKLLPNQTSEVITGFLSKTAYLVKLLEIKDPESPKLATVKDKAVSLYKERQAALKAKEEAEAFLKEALNSQSRFEQLAKAARQNVAETGLFKRNPSGAIPMIGNSPEAMSKGFSLAKNDPLIKNVVSVGKELYVVALKERTEADISSFESSKDDLMRVALEERRREYLDDWTSSLRNSAKIKRFELKELDF